MVKQIHLKSLSDQNQLNWNLLKLLGSSAGFIGDTINLTVTASPEGAQLPVVIWSVNISAYATVENGVVTLHRQGTVLVTATVNGISATHEITVQKVAAQIGSVNYGTIQDAITAASDSDTIVIFGGTHNEVLNITKIKFKLRTKRK